MVGVSNFSELVLQYVRRDTTKRFGQLTGGSVATGELTALTAATETNNTHLITSTTLLTLKSKGTAPSDAAFASRAGTQSTPYTVAEATLRSVGGQPTVTTATPACFKKATVDATVSKPTGPSPTTT